jgi:NAD(P) transhydrogenase subunit alpha
VVNAGAFTWPPPAPKLTAAPGPAQKKPEPKTADVKKPESQTDTVVALLVGAAALAGLGMVAPPSFMAHFTVFVLACFVGYMVVWNVTPALHTPLMSVTNAISSIIIIGALLQVSARQPAVIWIAGISILITSINITGGFAVTRRMLEMFRK